MASDKQKELSAFIKEVHTNLRQNAKTVGSDNAWKSHCEQKIVLQKYSECMKKLASFWELNSADKTETSNRIDWVHQECQKYYNEGRKYQQLREYDILKKMKPDGYHEPALLQRNDKNKLSFLDVGSCYNPFKKFELFDVLAIDLYPASEDVKRCDFLNVRISQNPVEDNTSIEVKQLKTNSFDIVVFSLFLEYLPSSEQRLLSCKKAYDLLFDEGLLIIITPDSKHVGANSRIMKSWRYTMANLGFMRIKYEKLTHLHCMIFRKCLFPCVAERWLNMHQTDGFDCNQLIIPQDLNEFEKEQPEKENIKGDIELFTELPFS